MLVLRVPEGEFVTIYDLVDLQATPIKIVITPQGSIGIEASSRYSIVRSDATNQYPKVAAIQSNRRAKA